MVRNLIALECDSCSRLYPSLGPMDGNCVSAADLRADTRCDGWSRRKLDTFKLRDLCPDCTRKAGKR
jgi:hypothetical protein